MSTTAVVVGLDPLHEDLAPLHLAAALADATGAQLVAVASYLHDPITDAITGGSTERDRKSSTTRALKRQTASHGGELVVAGDSSPAHSLHRVAEERHAITIVIGSTRRGPIGRLTTGSTAERLLQGASCPVVVAPPGLDAGWAPARIGAGYIAFPDGEAALRAAAGLAGAFGASLHAVTAIEEPVEWTRTPMMPDEVHRFGARRNASQGALDRALELAANNVDRIGEVVVAAPVEALVALSRATDLLVCGSRRYGPLRAVLLGGVTHRLMSEAHCPVVVVPRGAESAFERLTERTATVSR